VEEKSEKRNKRGDDGSYRTPVARKREDWLGVFDLGLGFPSAVEELSEPDGKRSGPPGQ